MKKNVFYAVMMMMVVMMTACSSDDDAFEPIQPAPKDHESRTVAQAKTLLVMCVPSGNFGNICD